MVRRARLWAIATCVAAAGCSTGASNLQVYSPSASVGAISYVLAPFSDLNPPEFSAKYPEAAKVVEGAFARALLKQSSLAGAPASILRATDLDAEHHGARPNWRAVARESQVDAVLSGQVHTYIRGYFTGPFTTVGFSVEAVDARSGTVLWTGSITRSTPWTYNYDPAAYAAELCEELVRALLKPSK